MENKSNCLLQSLTIAFVNVEKMFRYYLKRYLAFLFVIAVNKYVFVIQQCENVTLTTLLLFLKSFFN